MDDHTTSLRIFPTDLQLGSSTYSVSIIASSSTRSDQVIRIALERLKIYEDCSLYELSLGHSSTDQHEGSEIRLSASDCPVSILERERQGNTATVTGSGDEMCVFIRKKRSSTVTSLLSLLTDPSGSTAAGNDSSELLVNVNDLCKLDDLSEQIMLSILKTRFQHNHIYTYVGSILIAINPYYFYSIYNPKYSSVYQGRHLGELPPHVFAIADDSYSSMLNDKIDQAIIISGESGAGKTESTKFLLHQLMQLSAKYEETSSLDLITLGTGPVLEAFGNARTVANNNSSRFGKFILVKFKENGAYYGASIEKYLLEKSRIISQAPGERNYHVFYYLLSGADSALKEKLRLLTLDQYRYLRQPGVKEDSEPAEFQRLCESLTMLKFSSDIQESMFTILSAILHIGNIAFEKKDTEEGGVYIATMDTVHIISQLLQVNEHILSEALVTRKSKAGGIDSFVTHYKLDEAVATCDAMAKALYGALFDWIVNKVNEALVGQYAKGSHKGNTIGVLDIFGFEVFTKNSFEQFCINYANEQLQQYFNKHIFKLEQVEYDAEGIEWKSVTFIDNNDCIDLIAKKPTGLLPLLDEECSFPGADDMSLFQKFERQHKGHPSYSSPQLKKKDPIFTISHYASPVTYCIEGFREKNRDLMRQDVVDVLKTSRMDLVRSLIGLPPYAVHRWRTAIRAVIATVLFERAGRDRKERRAEDWTTSSPAALAQQSKRKRPVSSPPGSPSHITPPVNASFPRGLSASDLSILSNNSLCVDTPTAGHPTSTAAAARVVSKKYGQTTGKDSPDGAPLFHTHSSTQRHPSIAHLLKKKWHHSIRARIEGEEDSSSSASKKTNKDKLYRSAPRVKADNIRTSLSGCKLQQLAVNTTASRRGQTKTVSAEFHASLVYLMEQLERTHPYFIRCIKSNGNKAPREFDTELVTSQLRYTGMMETVRIRKSGFSVRIPFNDFYEKYQFLIGRRQPDLTNQIRVFLEGLGFAGSDIQIGTSKVFMKDKHKNVLQDLLQEKVLAKIILIQKWIRAKLHRCRYLQTRRSALLIQRYARGCLIRQQCAHIRKRICSAVIIQSSWRCYSNRKWFLLYREAAIVLQAYWRGIMARRRYLLLLEAIAEQKRREEEERRLKEEQERLEQQQRREEEERKMAEMRLLEEEKLKLLQQQQQEEEAIKETLNDLDSILANLSSDSRTSLLETTPTSIEPTGDERVDSTHQSAPPISPPNKDADINKRPTSPNVTNKIERFSSAGSNDNPAHTQGHAPPIGRVKSPFLELQSGTCSSRTPSPSDPTPKPRPGGVENARPLDSTQTSVESAIGQVKTMPIKEAPAVSKKPQRKKPVSPEPKTGITGAPPTSIRPNKSDDLLLDSLSDEELDADVAAITGRGTSPPAKMADSAGQRRSGVRSVGDETEESQSLKVVPSLGEIKSQSFDESSEFTRGIAPDEMYRINYQMRHSIDHASNDSIGSDGTSPVHEKEQRFVVKKKWGRKSPKPARNLRKDGGHPLLSKIQRITSPTVSSGESGSSTPTAGLSPMKKPKTDTSTQHTFKTSSMNKSQVCMVCGKAFSGFLKQGSKCVTCGIIVHKHCQDRAAICRDSSKVGQLVTMGTEIVVCHPEELDELAQFLVDKHQMHLQHISHLNPDKIEPIDRIFQMSLCEFHYNLVSNYSLSVVQDSSSDTTANGSAAGSSSSKKSMSYTFEQLVNRFASIYRMMAARENMLVDSSDVAIGVNQVRTFLDEFVKSRHQRVRALSNEAKSRPGKLRRRKSVSNKDMHIRAHKGHKFSLTQFKVVTVCDQCSSLIPVLAKGEMCLECSFACHEHCTKKVTLKCEGKGWSRGGAKGDDTKSPVSPQSSSKSHFGVPLETLVPAGVVKVPTFLEKCFSCIENNGLYTQGIYRRSAGGTSKRAVREALENDPEGADLDNFSLYAVAATVTSFFRELPEPLLTHQLYNDFIRATDLSDVSDMMETLHRIIERLPDLNHCVFERLIFNLARIAQQGAVNKMDPHNLAIIFSPSLLQEPDNSNPDQLLKMMPKQTKVIESIIVEQLDKLTVTLKGIHDLTSVARTAVHRLSKLKEEEKAESPVAVTAAEKVDDGQMEAAIDEKESSQEKERIEEEKQILTTELKLIERERAVLTASLPKLEPFPSLEEQALPFSHPLIQVTSSSHSINEHRAAIVTGTSREEFLKKQSMFTVGSSSGESNSTVPTGPNKLGSTGTVGVAKEEERAETVVDETVNNVILEEIEEELDELFPADLLSVQVLRPLTKDRVSKKPVMKRRPPARPQSQNSTGSRQSDSSEEFPLAVSGTD